MNVPDKIERQMVFNASRDTVWDAITQPEMLCKWFSNRIDVTELNVGQEFTFDWTHHGYSRAIVEVVEPKTRFAYRWENEGVDQSLPLSDVPKTLVTFVLDEVEDGTRLTLTETGFASLPTPKVNFDQNSSGWDTELGELKTFIETPQS